MALDPAVLARPVTYPPRPAEPEADLSPPADVIDPRQLAYQRARAAVTERARWEFLDRSTHQAQQALASALELVARLEAQVQALEARRVSLLPPASALPAPVELLVSPLVLEAAAQQAEASPLAEAVSEPLPPVVSGGVQHAPVQSAAVRLQP